MYRKLRFLGLWSWQAMSRFEKEDFNGNDSKKGNSMGENSTLEILKQAILLEKRGKAFYQNVAEKTENRAARDVFEMMAAEEQKHIDTLSEQFMAYRKKQKFIPGSYDSESSSVASKVLTEEIKEKISAAGFEAAAISAAILMEERAVKLYSEGMENTSDPEAKALFEWLARWEREHLSLLLDIDKSLKEKIWFDNKFWPF
jgi:rubrerythrin